SGSTATGLDPELLRRFEAAKAAARAAGVTLTLTSGWRSVAEQEQIIAGDIATYGSVTEAHRWVLPPDKSAHVQGEAIDVGPTSGAAWLGVHGGRFGLCRTYANEPWHFEPVIQPGGTCPTPPHADSSWGW
ncbi:MAG: M15 family metallopeptidase, partial [Cellulomonas sp.]|nr:M15 family metallopeptidase [Cellulomonas sp.]